MVHDHIKYASEYFNLSHGIRVALEYLQRIEHGALAPGRHEVVGDHVFALVSDYDTRSPDEMFWEAHRAHIDVQYVHVGAERIGYGDLADFECEPYDAERDLTVARGGRGLFVDVGTGEFVILFPHDVHMPGLTADAIQTVRKIVMKVRI